MDLVNELQRLARQRCAITIQSIDNPGWMVTIRPPVPLADKLRVEGDPPRPGNGNKGGASWLVCKIEGGQFTGAGDPTRLGDIFDCFSTWTHP